ncbi:MAG: hypothetical protein ACLFQ0_16600 [Cyclobacteriaceae bacterium]
MNRRESLKVMGISTAAMWLSPQKSLAHKLTVSTPAVTLSYRLHPELWQRPFAEIEKGLLQYKSAINEIALFDESLNHRTLMTMDEVERVASLMQQRIFEFKTAGIHKVGINVYDDIGVRNFEGGYTFDFRPMVGHDGKTRSFCPCPNDEHMQAFFLEKLKVYASANPDFIWIDDDFRNANKVGISYSCFCQECVDRFGQAGSRQELIAQLNESDNQPLREQWIQFMNNTLNELAVKIKKSVHEVNPRIQLGLMTIGSEAGTYAYDYHTWMQSMEAVKARPGHGYYNESKPRELIKKLLDVGRQVKNYPAITTDIQYELENWTYATLNKSVQTEMNECLLSLMMGCTGIAFNAIYANEWEEKVRMLKEISQQKKLWEKVNKLKSDLPLSGFWPMEYHERLTKHKTNGQGWLHDNDAYHVHTVNELTEVGIPFSNSYEDSCGVLMSGRIAEASTREELQDILSGAVYLDTAALELLWERGLGALTGVKPVTESVVAVEVFAEHPINHGMEGAMRRAYGWAQGSWLNPLNDQVQVVSELRHMSSQERMGPCLTLYENELGGRVAVSSYQPWKSPGALKKTIQLSRMMDFLSRGKMPVIMEDAYRIMPIIRISKSKDRFVLALFNNSLDELSGVECKIRTTAKTIRQITKDKDKVLTVKKVPDGKVVSLDKIKPWEVVMIAGN